MRPLIGMDLVRQTKRAECAVCQKFYRQMIGSPIQCLRYMYTNDTPAARHVKSVCWKLYSRLDILVTREIKEEL